MASFQETLRRLAIFDEGFVTEGSGHHLARAPALGPKTAALLQVGVPVAIGSSATCLEWSAARALAAGAIKDDIADVLLAIAPVAGMGRLVSAAPGVATALGYDIQAALEAPDVLLIALGRPRPDEERFWSFARCERVTVHLPGGRSG